MTSRRIWLLSFHVDSYKISLYMDRGIMIEEFNIQTLDIFRHRHDHTVTRCSTYHKGPDDGARTMGRFPLRPLGYFWVDDWFMGHHSGGLHRFIHGNRTEAAAQTRRLHKHVHHRDLYRYLQLPASGSRRLGHARFGFHSRSVRHGFRHRLLHHAEPRRRSPGFTDAVFHRKVQYETFERP